MSSSTVVVIEAGTLFTPDRTFSPGRLLIEDRTIAELGSPETVRSPKTAHRIDASGLFVAPGFIDPHVHGCGGVDVMEGTHDALNAVSRILARHGTTSFFPTTVSSPPDVLTRTVEQLGIALEEPFDGATPLGIHLEGPFINPAKRGTHQVSNVCAPNLELMERWIRSSRETIRLMTIAPELESIQPVLMLAQHHGIVAAMGHSNATFDQARDAADRGVCYAVHTFNAMRAFSHRDPGIVGEVLVDDRIFAEIIADGIHVHPDVVRLLARAKERSRVLLVTDAISATDMPDGSYRLGGSTVDVTNGVCRDSEGRLAGSTLTQEIALRNFVQWTRCSVEEALLAASANPARALGLAEKGILEPGADADVVIMDDQFRIMKTLVAGRVVFERI